LVFWFVHLTLNLPSQKERYGPISFRVALLTSLLFVAHPVQTQAVTYIVQRMTSMATMFYLLAMVLYIKGRSSEGRKQLLFYVGTAITGFSRSSPKRMPLCCPCSSYCTNSCFQIREADISWRGGQSRRCVSFVGHLWWCAAGDEIYRRHPGRVPHPDFTMSERVLTQLRVVLNYVTLLIFPQASRLNLDHDFVVSKGLFSPVSTFLSLVTIACLIGVAVWKMRVQPSSPSSFSGISEIS